MCVCVCGFRKKCKIIITGLHYEKFPFQHKFQYLFSKVIRKLCFDRRSH